MNAAELLAKAKEDRYGILELNEADFKKLNKTALNEVMNGGELKGVYVVSKTRYKFILMFSYNGTGFVDVASCHIPHA